MAGGHERSVKALREVWRRAENSSCADCGKPGGSPRAAGGRVRSRELGLVWLSDCTGTLGREGGEELLCLDICFLSLEVSWQGRRKGMLPQRPWEEGRGHGSAR